MFKAKKLWVFMILSTLALIIIIYFSTPILTEKQIVTYGYQIINTYPHDPQAFTQGLIYHQGYLYEGTGLRGYSSIRRVALETGKVLQIDYLPKRYFGEGITLWQNQLMQLTWKERTGFVYDYQTFKLTKQFSYNTEGWGLTHDNKYLIMSDGSEVLYFLDPVTFKLVKQVHVHDHNQSVTKLNELEYINDEIWANVWGSYCIARIAPTTGKVLAWINFKGLQDDNLTSNPNAVLNGIAYDQTNDRLFVTGKLWPKLFEVKTVPKLDGDVCTQQE